MKIEHNDNYVIGMELDGKMAKSILADAGLNVVKDSLSTVKFGAGEDMRKACVGMIGEMINKTGIVQEKIKAIGIGISKEIDRSVITGMEKDINKKIYFYEKPACAAFGEKRLNDEAAAQDLLYIYSDLASAVMLDGEDLRAMTEEEAKYLEPWKEGMGISALAKKEVSRGVGTKIVSAAAGSIGKITNETVIEAARERDEVALNIINVAGVNIGTRAAYLINLLGPQSVILGGGIEKMGDLILKPIKDVIGRLALRSRLDGLNIASAKLKDETVAIGAASLAVREFLKS